MIHSNTNSGSAQEMNPRLLDLMIKQSTEGLSESEQQELDQLAPAFPGESDRIDATVAAMDLAMLTPGESDATDLMPGDLRSKLESDAEGFFGVADKGSRLKSAIESSLQQDATAGMQDDVVSAGPAAARPATGGVTRREWISMTIAAASLFLVFSGLNPLAPREPDTDQKLAKSSGAPPEPDAEQKLAQFMAKSPDDIVNVDWEPKADAGATGRVVWSDEFQEGYMVFKGMKVNDPTVNQYQLWIFNTPTEKYPVDGGVFDISPEMANSNGEIIIPIDPKIRVRNAVQFAVTVEDPGGVVVSERETIPVLATLSP